MPPKHLPAPAAIQADDIIVVNGSPDRNRRGSLDNGFWRVCRDHRAPDGRSRSRWRVDPVGPDCVEHTRRRSSRRSSVGCSSGIAWSPLFPPATIYPPRSIPGGQIRTLHIAVGPTTPSWFRPSFDRDPPGLSLNGSPGREVERKIYGGNFLMLPPGTAYGLPWPGFPVAGVLRVASLDRTGRKLNAVRCRARFSGNAFGQRSGRLMTDSPSTLKRLLSRHTGAARTVASPGRRGDRVAARGARAAEGDAGDRLPQHASPGPCAPLWPRSARD